MSPVRTINRFEVSVPFIRTGLLVRALIAGASLLSATMGGAQIPDLKLPGNLPGQLTEFGVGMRDAIRRKLGTCNRAVDGTILVCGHREQYRIDRNLLEAERNASRSGSSEYEEYLEARARHPNQGD